ncbi:unnamed protein product [Strongylus vulgaris]|uniref:Uncharacterized protein n=1 Tax=Strongylus vulgaris TaxID=40348 RepID=A0A3P7JBJ0_STRVU|nr:unnamed protein product [Strongylus vulgaris]
MDTINGAGRKEDNTLPRQYLRMMFYTFYQPYLFSLIVLYEDFEEQMMSRKAKERNWKECIFFAIRIAFWWTLLEVALHFFYQDAIMKHVEYASTLPKNQLFSLALTLGEFYFLFQGN